MTKQATDSMKAAATDAFAKSQEFATKSLSSSEKMFDSVIEYNAAIFKGSEVVGKKAYDNYVSNVAASFEGLKALNKANDVAEFYKVASSNVVSASERFSDQSKNIVELSGKVLKETSEAARLAYTKNISVS